jgi:hypothetical protein
MSYFCMSAPDRALVFLRMCDGAGAMVQGRDVFNEKPAEEEMLEGPDAAQGQVLPAAAVLHTCLGDICVRLHGEKCPKTVENFATHAKNGYYDGLIFHRVIKNFMIQTGVAVCAWWGGLFVSSVRSILYVPNNVCTFWWKKLLFTGFFCNWYE